MVTYGFIFDIVVLRVDTPNQIVEDSNSLTVSVNFNDVPLEITASRINVVEFRSDRSYEFDADPNELRCELESCPLKLKVKYKDETVGVGEMPWPVSVLEKISGSLGELIHIGDCDLFSGENYAGCVEIIVRLQCKCQESVSDEDCRGDQRKNLASTINPQDILFVLGEGGAKDCDIDDNPSDCGVEGRKTHLDLSRYQNVHGKVLHSPDILNTCVDTDCCGLKQLSNEYQQLLDRITSRSNQKFTWESDESSESLSSASADSSDGTQFGRQSDIEKPDSGRKPFRRRDNVCTLTSSSMDEQLQRRGRRCSICGGDVSWLPQWAACPKCGYKPSPYVKEKNYNDKMTSEKIVRLCLEKRSSKLTSDQIIKQYLEKSSSISEEQDSLTDECKDELETRKRCTCQLGKVCAHCRIRELCKETFGSNSSNFQETDLEASDKCEKTSSKSPNICKTSSNDSSTYLKNVLSQLKNVFEGEIDTDETKCDCEDMLQDADKMEKRREMHPQQPRVKRKQRNSKKNTGILDVCAKNILSKLHKKNSKRKNCKNSFFFPRPYPRSGLKTCHRICCNSNAGQKNVPHNMGWLWNRDVCRARSGWKPGAIRKPVKEIMKFFLKDFPADTLIVSKYAYRNQGKVDGKQTEKLVQKPTLQIRKRNDEYLITMHPLKDKESLKSSADPYVNMKPLQFKIVQNPLVAETHKLKRCLKDMGFPKCTCHKPISECFCRSLIDKRRLEYQTNKECQKRNMPSCIDSLVLSDTSGSDEEFDFGVTPPAGVIKPWRLNKPDLVHQATQYEECDWNMLPPFPKPPSKYIKLYDRKGDKDRCAAIKGQNDVKGGKGGAQAGKTSASAAKFASRGRSRSRKRGVAGGKALNKNYK